MKHNKKNVTDFKLEVKKNDRIDNKNVNTFCVHLNDNLLFKFTFAMKLLFSQFQRKQLQNRQVFNFQCKVNL